MTSINVFRRPQAEYQVSDAFPGPATQMRQTLGWNKGLRKFYGFDAYPAEKSPTVLKPANILFCPH